MSKFFAIFTLFIVNLFFSQEDIIAVKDVNKSEIVNFQKITSTDDGKKIDDSKVDGIIYKKINGFYYKRIIPNKVIDVTWFGSNSAAIQKAIDLACVDFGVLRRAQYSVYLPERVYTIDKKIVIRNVEGMHLYGGGIGTLLQIKENTNLDAVLELNGTAFGVYENFYFGGSKGSSCDSFINMFWGDKVSAPQPANQAYRSSTQNSFANIRNISGKFKHAVKIDGHNQNDMSMWYNCSFNGNWNPNEKNYFLSAFYIGDGKAGNNLIHNFQNNYISGVKTAYIFAATGGSITGGGASNVDTFIVRENVNETLLISSVRLEGTSRIYRNDGYLNGVHGIPDNVTFQNLWYSGNGASEKYFQPAEDGILIYHAGGTMNIIGSTIYYFNNDNFFKIKLSGAMNKNFHNALNIIGCNFQAKFNDMFIVDNWAQANVNIIGSNETTGYLGTQMSKHFPKKSIDFNYTNENIENIITPKFFDKNAPKGVVCFSLNQNKIVYKDDAGKLHLLSN